jgi:hypothetical protein
MGLGALTLHPIRIRPIAIPSGQAHDYRPVVALHNMFIIFATGLLGEQ